MSTMESCVFPAIADAVPFVLRGGLFPVGCACVPSMAYILHPRWGNIACFRFSCTIVFIRSHSRLKAGAKELNFQILMLENGENDRKTHVFIKIAMCNYRQSIYNNIMTGADRHLSFENVLSEHF